MTDVNSLEKTGGRALPHERTAAAISVKIIRQSNYSYYNFSVMKNVIRSSKMNTTHTAMLLIFSLSTSLTFGGEIKSLDIPNENVIILKPTPGDFCLGYDIITPATINDNLILINQSKKGDGFGRYGYPQKKINHQNTSAMPVLQLTTTAIPSNLTTWFTVSVMHYTRRIIHFMLKEKQSKILNLKNNLTLNANLNW